MMYFFHAPLFQALAAHARTNCLIEVVIEAEVGVVCLSELCFDLIKIKGFNSLLNMCACVHVYEPIFK